MKKLLFLISAAALTLTSCTGDNKTERSASEQQSVVSTTEDESATISRQPSGNIVDDAQAVFDKIKLIGSDKSVQPEAQAMLKQYNEYYKQQGRDKEFVDTLSAITVREMNKARAQKGKQQ